MRCNTHFALVLCACLALQAPIARAGQDAKPEALTNDTVVEMVRAGLSTSIIVSKVRMSAPAYDLSAKELVRLKNSGVPDEVIEAMIQAGSAAGSVATASPRSVLERSTPPDPAAPGLPTAPGVYLVRGEQLTQVEPNVYSESKVTGALKTVFTSGIAKAKTKAVLAGAHARLQIDDARPVFYFAFDVANAGLSNAAFGALGPATSPNEFVLVEMHVSKAAREVTTGEYGLTGMRVGASEKELRQFDFERVRPGLYRLVPREPLASGEYCFFYAGTVPEDAAGSTVFDFGVRKPEPPSAAPTRPRRRS
jgi:hypothetical protein